MSVNELRKGFDSVQGIIGEYEAKTSHPTLSDFSMWLERRKQYAILEYEKHSQNQKMKR